MLHPWREEKKIITRECHLSHTTKKRSGMRAVRKPDEGRAKKKGQSLIKLVRKKKTNRQSDHRLQKKTKKKKQRRYHHEEKKRRI